MRILSSAGPLCRLDEVATIERDAVAPDAIRSGTNYVGLEHINSDGSFVGMKSVSAGELASNKFRFGPKHILFGKLRPYLRKTALPDFEGICSTDIVPILPGQRVDRRYLFHFLRHPKTVEQAVLRCAGANLPRLSPRDLSAFEVPVPPLPDQRCIADILDKADAIRRKRKEAIALTEELLRAAFLDMFGDPVTNPKGWQTVSIEALASADRHALAIGPFGSNLLASDYTASGHPVVFVRDLVTGRFAWKSNVFVSAAKFAELAPHHAHAGDVVATKMGDPPGVACVIPEGFPRAVVTADVVKVAVDRSAVFPEYLAAAINSPFGRQQISGITAGVTRAKITLRDFREVRVRLPPLEQQRKYANHAAKLECTRARLALGAAEADRLFSSLTARVFSGLLEISC